MRLAGLEQAAPYSTAAELHWLTTGGTEPALITWSGRWR